MNQILMTGIFFFQAKSRILCNCDKKSMPYGNFTCIFRTHFKEVLDVLFTYSFIKKNDVITASKI